jgi:hypothetical protein
MLICFLATSAGTLAAYTVNKGLIRADRAQLAMTTLEQIQLEARLLAIEERASCVPYRLFWAFISTT